MRDSNGDDQSEYGYDEVCGYFPPGQHSQSLHDSWESLEKANPGRFEDNHFDQRLHKVLTEKPEARVYFVVTSCGMSTPARTGAKVRKWVAEHPRTEYVTLPSWENRRVPAVKATIKSGRELKEIWASLVKISAPACGCSAFISDAQEIDVRVMSMDYIAGGEES